MRPFELLQQFVVLDMFPYIVDYETSAEGKEGEEEGAICEGKESKKGKRKPILN